MNSIGIIVLSFEEAGDLSALLPWKEINGEQVYGPEGLFHKIPLSGLICLSTCNRVEFIYSITDETNQLKVTKEMLEELPILKKGVSPSIFIGRDAVQHLLRLATGLESLVLGETEIRAQMKQAFDTARDNDALDFRLRTLFQDVFKESKTIRSSIPMNNLPLSVATLAVRKIREPMQVGFAAELNGSAKEQGATVVIGSGPMSRQSAQYLSKWSSRLVLVNRSLDKIQETADRLGAEMVSFDDFMENPEALGPVAAIITATSRQDAFITKEFVTRLRNHNAAPDYLYIVDLALPADVAEECIGMDGVEVVNLEALREELEQNKQKRQRAAACAEQPVQEALYRVKANLIASLSGPIIKEMQKDIRDKSRDRLEMLLDGHLSHLSTKDKRMLYMWAIQANRDMNRIHRTGVENVLRTYYTERSGASAGNI